MDYILEADIYEGCSQLNMLEYSLEHIGIDENEFVNEGVNIKEKAKNIGKTILNWIDNARGFLKKILDFIFRKSKVVDTAFNSAEKKAEQAVDNMDKTSPEQAGNKANRAINNIEKITMNLNKQIEMKDTEKSTSSDGTTGTKADIVPINKGDISTTKTDVNSGKCTVKTLNTQKVGDFLANAQQQIHGISSCAHDMDKIFKSINVRNPEETDIDKLSKKDTKFVSKVDTVLKMPIEYANPAKAFLEDEVFTVKDLARKPNRPLFKEIIQVINTNKKYIDSIQDRLEKIINQSDKELANVRKKVVTYGKVLDDIMRSSYNKTYESISNAFYNLRTYARISNKTINNGAQFVIKYKTTLAGYLSAIAATSSSQAA